MQTLVMTATKGRLPISIFEQILRWEMIVIQNVIQKVSNDMHLT